ncbi:hypothetical protein LIER_37350 [Lithospermum erythrorhizon]|uniref:Uncharacterized protein n=1 Tax=Lithospermum erythrorhizon TaxID=34254 RepID=A0AAV3PNH1_LITER
MLKPISFPSLICSLLKTQHTEVLTEINEDGVDPKPFIISHKLLKGTHVADVPIPDVSTDEVITSGQTAAVKILQDEITHLEGVIQSSLARKSILEVKVKTLMEASSSGDNKA